MARQDPSGPRQSVKLALFALSGNQCAFPGCDASMFDADTIVGEVCHIHGQRGPRHKEGLSGEELHAINNLILLCQKHHKIVDDSPGEYDAAWLTKVKQDHESRASATPNQALDRLIGALALEVPENWWERPGAPVFRFNLASSRPHGGTWVFEVEPEQIDGADIGNLRYRYCLGEDKQDLRKPTLLKSRKWKLDNLFLNPQGEPLELELRFWWAGADRSVSYRWEKEAAFQSNSASVRYS